MYKFITIKPYSIKRNNIIEQNWQLYHRIF